MTLSSVDVSSAPLYGLNGSDVSGALRPLLVTPRAPSEELVSWIKDNLRSIESLLVAHGCILFRGFLLRAAEDIERVLATFSEDFVDYKSGTGPRERVSGIVYTSTELDRRLVLPLHNELSYSRRWPRKICFVCVTPPTRDGETPLADSRAMLRRINPEVTATFERLNVMYVRNLGREADLDVSWREAFETDSKEDVASFCRANGIDFEWVARDVLRTKQIANAVVQHPVTGERIWFNQAHLFHLSRMDRKTRVGLLAKYGHEYLPRNALYGDGSPIPASVIQEISDAYDSESVLFKWEEGDVLLADNMLVAHGRRPFEGPRKILVGMTEPYGP